MPLLLPAPRSATWSGGTCRPDAPTTTTVDATLATEGYVLAIATDGVAIRHRDGAGLRHARATLAQLAAQGPLPCGTVEDAPAFAVRGVMLDCSRDRIPTLAELRRLVAQMAAWKLNRLELYSEHAIAYRGHEAVTGPADAIGLDELALLRDEAAALGVELAPNQNCFGHLERWFRHPRYEPLAEQPGDPGHHHRSGCRALAPAVPAAFAFVQDLVGQLAGALPAPVFNIGGDETWDVGRGRSRGMVERDGFAAVYGGFLAKVMAEVRRHGRTPAFWADIVLNHPEAAALLDRGAIALDWGYGGRHDFDTTQQKLIAAGFARRWICPGTSCWSSFGGCTDERRANLRRAVRAAAKHGAEGVMVTVWGDGGHRQIWPASLAGIAEAAHRCWAGDTPYDPRAGGLHAFGCAGLGPWLDDLGRIDQPLRDGCRWETVFRALHGAWDRHPDLPWAMSGPTVTPGATAPGEWDGIAAAARALAGRLPDGIDAGVAEECLWACRMAELGAERGRELAGGDPRPGDWPDRLAAGIAGHRRLWLRRARPGGLDDSAGAFLRPLG